MRQRLSTGSQEGFSLTELLISILVLLPVMGAAVGMFSVGAQQHATEQSAIDANQEARTALEIMTAEIGQAGSHGDVYTTLTSSVGNSTAAQAAPVASTTGLTVGDFVTVGTPDTVEEFVRVTAVSSNTFSGIFRVSHTAGTPVRLFALPYKTGIIAPPGMTANGSATVTTLRFFGDINSNSTVQYVEYSYDSANRQITRSATPVTQSTKNPAMPFVRNVKDNSVQFTLYSDAQNVITAVRVTMTVENSVKSGSKLQETTLSSRISVPSAIAASGLLNEIQLFGGVDRMPDTPPKVTEWISYEDQ